MRQLLGLTCVIADFDIDDQDGFAVVPLGSGGDAVEIDTAKGSPVNRGWHKMMRFAAWPRPGWRGSR